MMATRRNGKSHTSTQIIARMTFAFWLGVLLAPLAATSATAQIADTDREVVSLTGTHANVQFLAGRSVTINANVADDVFAAGRYVTFDAASVNNAIVAGCDVEQRGGTTTDFFATAANLKIAGAIQDDLVAGVGPFGSPPADQLAATSASLPRR
jgi:hypothetical protein